MAMVNRRNVRIFKTVIISAIIAMIVIPTIIAIVQSVRIGYLQSEIVELYTQVADLSKRSERNSISNKPLLDSPGGSASQDEENPFKDYHPGLWIPTKDRAPDNYTENSSPMIYFTFDDGPSPVTDEVLDILKEKGVKATFFVIGREDEESKRLYKRIVDEGHAIAMHSYTHDYSKVYASIDSFLEEFERLSQVIVDATGVKPTVYRFPGGSNNSNVDPGLMKEIIQEMGARGYVFYDWHTSAEDAVGHSVTEEHLYNAIMKNINNREKSGYNRAIILAHDSSANVNLPKVLPRLIDELKERGYLFDSVTNRVQPEQFVKVGQK